MNKATCLWAVTLAYLVFTFYLSSLPKTAVPVEAGGIPFFSQAFHFAEYATLGVLLQASFAASLIREGVLCFTSGVAWAVADEVHQSFVPGRDADVGDIIVDAAGLMFGLLLFRRIVRGLSKGQGKMRR